MSRQSSANGKETVDTENPEDPEEKEEATCSISTVASVISCIAIAVSFFCILGFVIAASSTSDESQDGAESRSSFDGR